MRENESEHSTKRRDRDDGRKKNNDASTCFHHLENDWFSNESRCVIHRPSSTNTQQEL